MHELSITESLLKLALSHAQDEGAQRVTDLYLVIGPLSALIDESLAFYWEIVSKGTLAQDARLHFRRIPLRLHCQDCEHEFIPDGEILACPHCDSLHIRILAGDEFRLEAIDIETDEGTP